MFHLETIADRLPEGLRISPDAEIGQISHLWMGTRKFIAHRSRFNSRFLYHHFKGAAFHMQPLFFVLAFFIPISYR